MPDPIEQHQQTVQALSKPGGPLSADSPTATVHQPQWFRYVQDKAEPRAGRRRLHDRLINEAMAEPGIQAGRQAILLAGPPGAGKSTVINQEILPGEASAGYLWVDADKFKEALLRQAISDGSYDRIMPAEVAAKQAAGERFFPLELAALVHEESSMLAAQVRKLAIEEGYNLIIDTVLSNRAAAGELGGQLAEAGYDIRIVDVEVPFELSATRVANRWRDSYQDALQTEDGLGGRWVPSEYARSVFTSEGRARSQAIAQNLAQNNPAVMRYTRYWTPSDTAGRQTEEDQGRFHHGGDLLPYNLITIGRPTPHPTRKQVPQARPAPSEPTTRPERERER